ncbi:GfV-C6-ORF1 [Ichnoviriform fumiferanae]|uniref:GfV-C6-ORF1 n=1 Tax=Ichnoviriform fumiferanae TaxID=419435 RepID=A2PZW7_9VIRU|nr:GfV-C6-ORF1 [Ichnoviriform fumiferanae]BAF45539.1 GfV-C6-ORF1 [Ichnoviriform fumiferanae]
MNLLSLLTSRYAKVQITYRLKINLPNGLRYNGEVFHVHLQSRDQDRLFYLIPNEQSLCQDIKFLTFFKVRQFKVVRIDLLHQTIDRAQFHGIRTTIHDRVCVLGTKKHTNCNEKL